MQIFAMLFIRIFFFISLLIDLVSGEIVRLSECNKFGGSFSVKKENHKVVGGDSLIRENTSPTLEHCIADCVKGKNCQSICYNSNSKRCELHSANQSAINVEISPREGWVYMQTKDGEKYGHACSASKCVNGICEELCEAPFYRCSCYANYTGKDCTVFMPETYHELYGGNFYYFSSDQLFWINAELACVSIGGHLASIHSSQENQFIYDKLSERNVPNGWIGFNDLEVLGTYVWSDGTVVDYTMWRNGDQVYGEPNNPNENCVMMYHVNVQRSDWVDISCQTLSRYVCKAKAS